MKIEQIIELDETHYCTLMPTMSLRWRKAEKKYIPVNINASHPMDDRKLEQAFSCQGCGKAEWVEVPMVKEGAK